MSYKLLLVTVFLTAWGVQAWAEDQLISPRPNGTGDPDATTCRPPQQLPSSRMLGPQVCKLNSQWALLRKNGQDISADGTQIITDPKGGNAALGQCTVAGGGATGGGMPVCH